MLAELPLLFFAGFFGGMLNSIAGGGTFITFPALMFAGVPPISANATNTFASCSGYISGTYALRHDLKANRKELPACRRLAIRAMLQLTRLVLVPWGQRAETAIRGPA